jgi:hypothetical protein
MGSVSVEVIGGRPAGGVPPPYEDSLDPLEQPVDGRGDKLPDSVGPHNAPVRRSPLGPRRVRRTAPNSPA